MSSKATSAETAPTQQLVGWREWVVFPEFGGTRVKAKTDTGARTSAIDAHNIDVNSQGGVEFATFELRLNPADPDSRVSCRAPIVARRSIRNSGGDQHDRLIVTTSIALAGSTWPIELSLTQRPNMKFPMLLGRTSIAGRFFVDVSRSYLASDRNSKETS